MIAKRFHATILFVFAVVILNHFGRFNLFSMGLQRTISAKLFSHFANPEVDQRVVVLNIDGMPLDSVKAYMQVLRNLAPQAIGVNLCDVQTRDRRLDRYFEQMTDVVICDCDKQSTSSTSAIVGSRNEVTHFRADKDSYFEIRLVNRVDALKERGTTREWISFRHPERFYHASLNEIYEGLPHIYDETIVIVGFSRGSWVTPMNARYGEGRKVDGDMSAAQVSSNIVLTILRSEFMNEVGLVPVVGIFVAAYFLCAGLIRLVRVKNNFVNILIAVIIFFGLNVLSAYLIVVAFTRGYFLELNGMPWVLMIAAVLTVYWNTAKAKTVPQEATIDESPPNASV